MTWEQAHRRYAALREVEQIADADPTGALPWRHDFADVFGDRVGLLVALRHRWRVLAEAQLDPECGADVVGRARGRLEAEHAGLLRVLVRHDGRVADPWQPWAEAPGTAGTAGRLAGAGHGHAA